MRFYDREDELKTLRRIEADSHESARFVVLTGRRRVGKTELVKHAFGEDGFLYFFVGRRSAAELCENYVQEISVKLGMTLPAKFDRIADVVKFVMEIAKTRHVTLVIDEFQELQRVEPGAFADLQRDWDLMHDKVKLNLVVSGSIYRMMNKLFRDRHEPLYGRQTEFLKLKPFSLDTLKEILSDHKRAWTPEDLLALYMITGGVAKYVEILMLNHAYDRDAMLDVVFRPESWFLEEGRVCLADEFGRDYGTYFSILSSIAGGRTRRSEIEQVLGGDLGAYIKNLSEDYELVQRNQPLFAKPNSRNIALKIDDNFFSFWFRFVAHYRYMLEIWANNRLKELVKRDYKVFSGQMLERYFRQKLAESGEWTRIGSWWDRKGENEIDLIAESELDGRSIVCEVKRDKSRIDLDALKAKFALFADAVGGKWKRAKPDFLTLSMEDM